jgi:hypothetical protein
MRPWIVVAFVAAACGTSSPQHKPLPPDQAAEMLHERLWLDHAPRTTQDRFQLVLFDEHGSGIRQHRTVWKGDFELFFHEVDGNELEFFLPASGTSMRSAFRITRVAGPDQADAKLVIEHPPTGAREYWGWRFEGGSTDAWLTARFGDRR